MKKSLSTRPFAMPSPAWVVGTYGDNGEPDISTAGWAGICSGNPASLMVAFQKIRYTYANILRRRAFTVNIMAADQVVAVDYVGIAGGRDTDKFADTGWTPIKSELVDAPYVREAPLVIECSLLHSLDIGMHTLFVGKIEDTKAEEVVLGENGLPDIKKVNPLVFSFPEREYYAIGEYLGRAFSIGTNLKE